MTSFILTPKTSWNWGNEGGNRPLNEPINFHVRQNAQSDFCYICQDGLGYTEVTNKYQYKH